MGGRYAIKYGNAPKQLYANKSSVPFFMLIFGVSRRNNRSRLADVNLLKSKGPVL